MLDVASRPSSQKTSYPMASSGTGLDPFSANTDSDFDNLLADLLPADQRQISAWSQDMSGLTTPSSPLLQYNQQQPIFKIDQAWQQVPIQQQQQQYLVPETRSCNTGNAVSSCQLAPGVSAGPVSASTSAKKGGKKSDAWILKNRRAQQKHRNKQKAS